MDKLKEAVKNNPNAFKKDLEKFKECSKEELIQNEEQLIIDEMGDMADFIMKGDDR